MICLLPQFVRRAGLPLAVQPDHAFAPSLGDAAGRRCLEDATLEEIEQVRRAGYVVVRLVPRAGRYSAVLVPNARGGYRVGATSYELDRLVGDPHKAIASIAPNGPGRWVVAWLDVR